jgi:hypothetical protein
MGNLCCNTPERPLKSKPLKKSIIIRKDSLFTIPELSPKLEFSEARSTPLVTPINKSTSKKHDFNTN